MWLTSALRSIWWQQNLLAGLVWQNTSQEGCRVGEFHSLHPNSALTLCGSCWHSRIWPLRAPVCCWRTGTQSGVMGWQLSHPLGTQSGGQQGNLRVLPHPGERVGGKNGRKDKGRCYECLNPKKYTTVTTPMGLISNQKPVRFFIVRVAGHVIPDSGLIQE